MASNPSRLFVALAHEGHMTLSQVLDLARQDRYNGAVTLHFRDGRPMKAEAVPRSYQATLDDEPEVLDNRT